MVDGLCEGEGRGRLTRALTVRPAAIDGTDPVRI